MKKHRAETGVWKGDKARSNTGNHTCVGSGATSFVGLMLAFLVIIVSTPGCATLFAPATHPLALSTDPPEAEVYVNGFMRGVTPLELNLKADMSYTIEFRKEGYDPVIRIVNTRIGAGWVILDVIGGLVPVVVDAATGAWNELDQDTVNAVLRKQDVQTNPAPADSP